MRTRDIIFGAGTFAFVLGLLLLVWLLPFFVPIPPAAQYAPGPTPKSFPRILAWVLLATGTLVLVLDVVTQPDEDGPGEHVFELSSLMFFLIATCFYIGLFQLAGFNVSTFLFLTAFFCFFSPLNLLRSSALSLVVTAVIAVVFGSVLKIPLPTWTNAF